MLSDYSLETKKRHAVSSGKVSKLVTTLMNKVKYVLHYRNLQLYLSLGLKLKKNTSCFRIRSESLVKRVY